MGGCFPRCIPRSVWDFSGRRAVSGDSPGSEPADVFRVVAGPRALSGESPDRRRDRIGSVLFPSCGDRDTDLADDRTMGANFTESSRPLPAGSISRAEQEGHVQHATTGRRLQPSTTPFAKRVRAYYYSPSAVSAPSVMPQECFARGVRGSASSIRGTLPPVSDRQADARASRAWPSGRLQATESIAPMHTYRQLVLPGLPRPWHLRCVNSECDVQPQGEMLDGVPACPFL